MKGALFAVVAASLLFAVPSIAFDGGQAGGIRRHIRTEEGRILRQDRPEAGPSPGGENMCVGGGDSGDAQGVPRQARSREPDRVARGPINEERATHHRAHHMTKRNIEVGNKPEIPEMSASRSYNAYIKAMLRKRILFIDDEYLLREAIYEMLTEMDYEVTVEEGGDAAIKTFTGHPRKSISSLPIS